MQHQFAVIGKSPRITEMITKFLAAFRSSVLPESLCLMIMITRVTACRPIKHIMVYVIKIVFEIILAPSITISISN